MKIVKILSTLGAAAGIALSASCGSTGSSAQDVVAPSIPNVSIPQYIPPSK